MPLTPALDAKPVGRQIFDEFRRWGFSHVEKR